MLIANPIYDSVFKYLMLDITIAKCLISNIIEEEIIELVFSPQESSTRSDKFTLTVFRLDFKALIKTKTGEIKKVLIELQKGKNPLDIARFRRYLGQNYIKKDDFHGEEALILPIITIYFLGFELSIETPVIKIGRNYIDVKSGEDLRKRDTFIENLTHDSYVIQIKYLPPKIQTKLEKLLSFFNQMWVFDPDNKWIMAYQGVLDDEDQKRIAARLALAAESEEVHDKVALEEDFEFSLEEALRERERALIKKEEALIEAQKQLKAEAEKKKAEAEKKKTEAEKKKVEDKEQEIEELKKIIAEMQKK